MNVPEFPLGELIEKIPILVWSCRSDGTAEFLNQRWLDYTGLPLEEAVGWGWQVAIHPEDLGKFMDTSLRLLSSGGQSEVRLRRFDGEYRWFIFQKTPVHDEQGKVVRWYGSSTDIDLQKRAEEELVKTERQLRTLVENYPGFMTRFDEEARHLSVSPSVTRALGLPLEQILGKTIHELGVPGPPGEKNDALLDAMVAGIKQAFEQGRPHTYEARWASPSGERVFETSHIPEQDEYGRVVSDLVVTREITERKRAEEALRRSEAYLAEAQRLTHTGSWAVNVATGEVTHSSEEASRLFGIDPARVPSMQEFRQRVHPEDRDRCREAFDRAVGERTDYEMDYRAVLPDGTIKYFHTIGHPVFNAAGDPVEYMGTSMDVTERKRAEDALHKAQAELAHVARVATLGEMTASIAHEINQPLGAIVNNAGACLRWLAAQNTEEARQSAALVIRDGHRASEIIGRIRALVMKAPAPKDWLDINETIREVIALAHFEMQRNGVAIETQLSDDVPLLLGDRIQLQQVLLNLMMNAIEAMSGAGEGPRELLVRSDKQESQNVLVAVQDSGPGLDPKRLDNLFDAFYTTKPRGLGMGLAISRSIIEAHGGRLWATANDGKGATFRFTLPSEGERPA